MFNKTMLTTLVKEYKPESATETEILKEVADISALYLRRYSIFSADEKLDIAQNVLIRFWKKLKAGKINTERSVIAYICKMCKTEAFRLIRSQKLRRTNYTDELELSATTKLSPREIRSTYR